ncbi:MAG: 50S ribosomal protein L25/general stress protein Ctc [Acidiferrobacterales bacterium]
MATKFELTGEKRDGKGSGANRRLRRQGKVPAVLYGGTKDPVMLSFDHDAIYHHLENEAFHTSILTVKVDGEADQAILRDVQMHPYKPRVVHMDLQRISATAKLHMLVPIHLSGEDMAPGVKQQNGIVSRLMTEVDISCLPHQLPEYLTVDISHLQIGEAVHLSDLPLPEGVVITSLAHGGEDLAVATIAAVRVVEEEVPEEAAEEVAEGEEAPAVEGEAAPGEEEKDKEKEKEKDKGKE